MPERVIAPEGAPTGGTDGLGGVGVASAANSTSARAAVAPEGAPTRLAHARNLRKGRWSGIRQTYLITTVTHHRERLFDDQACARAVIQVLRHTAEKGVTHTHAFVVMPGHLHWLISLGEEIGLSAAVGRVKGESARRINALLGRSAQPVWQHGFHDHALRREEDMRDIARYVVANPLRAGLVARLGEYPWWDAEWL